MSEPPAPRCLCIVSGDPVRSGELLDALRTMVDTHEVEIIVDRRRGEFDTATEQPPPDGGRQPSVDARWKLEGSAMVRDPPPFLADPPPGGVSAGRSFDELLAGAPLGAAPAEPELESVLEFNRRRKG